MAWLKNGVMVKKETLPVPKHWTSIVLVLSADHLRTDLTGFNLAESEEKTRARERSVVEVGRRLAAC